MTNNDQSEAITGFQGSAGTALREAKFMLSKLPQGGIFIEIGTYNGATIAYMAKERPDATFISIDPFPNEVDTRTYNTIGTINSWRANRQENNFLFVGTMKEFLRFSQVGFADIVFVDGNHYYDFVLSDLEDSLLLLKPEGIIMAHDFNREGIPDVERAVNEFLTITGWKRKELIWTTAMLAQE